MPHEDTPVPPKTRQRTRSRDSGSHSRSGSISSANSGCNVVVKLTPAKDKRQDSSGSLRKTNEFLPKPQKYEKMEKKQSPSQNSESGLSSSPSTLSSEEEVRIHGKISFEVSY